MTDPLKFVRSHKNLTKAWHQIRRNAQRSSSPYVKDDADQFASNEQTRIRSISSQIYHQSFRFGKARGVAIPKGPDKNKIRPLVLAKAQDRVVQRCILDALISVPSLKAHAFRTNSFGGIPKQDTEVIAGVPAAIKTLLTYVEAGMTHVMVADIEGFFTKISKSSASSIVGQHVTDQKFLQLFEQAIAVDLENWNMLWRHKLDFPRDDMGVAQGNCLSPFIGNMVLGEFDDFMNQSDCACLRYIDDIIILAPSGKAASARFRKAEAYLAKHGMNFAPTKTSPVPIEVVGTFEYLGIESVHQKNLVRKSLRALSRWQMLRCKQCGVVRASTISNLISAFQTQ
jgi:RNA-directed DNA polymerase